MKPLISIGVPIYNVEKFLPECLSSIQNQSYENLEIILVDDGSTDKSGKIADKFAADDDRFRVIHTSNGGSCVARNLILDQFKGDYLSFIDSDDYIDRNFISILYDALILTHSDISTCNLFSGWYDLYSINASSQVFEGDDIMTAYILEKFSDNVDYVILASTVNKLYRRGVVKNVRFPSSEGGGLIRRDNAEDQVWIPKVLVNIKRLCCISTPLYTYRQRPVGLVRRTETFEQQVGTRLNLLAIHETLISSAKNQTALQYVIYDYLLFINQFILSPFIEIGNFYELIRYIAISNQDKILRLLNDKPTETKFINLLIQNENFQPVREFLAHNMFGGI